MPAESTQAAAGFTAAFSVPVSARMAEDNTHKILWALAESHFRQAQQRVHSSSGSNGKLQNAHDSDDWQSSVVAGVSCLYSVLRLCSSSRGPSKSGCPAMILGPDVEAKTRLRIAQALGQWCSESSGNQEQGEEDNEEEAQLVRAIMVVPKADGYVDTRYAIIATHCRLFLRRGEHRWAEQKLKSAAVDAQQRSLYHWVHYFALELAHLYVASNNVRSALEVLQQSLKQAQQGSDRASEAVVGVQLLGLLIQERSWADAFALAKDLAAPMFDSALVALPQVRARFWSLQAAGSAMLGHHQGAQEACDSARQCLKEWQALFAKALTKKCVSDGGSSFVISGTRYGSVLRVRGWSYYEAHAWVMLVSAHATRGDNAHEKATGFLRLALEGIKRGETDGFSYQLKTTKLLVLLHVVDKALVTLQLSEAKLALDQIMVAAAEGQGPEANVFWHQSRDAIALRWAMYRHRMGDFDQAKDAYTCVAASDSQDLRFVAQVNQALMHVLANTDDSRERAHDIIKLLINDCGSLEPHEAVRRSMLEFLQGLESLEPVKAKTHLLACLRTCTEVADTALQGWTLCLLGTLVLSTGQYDQAMKMCAAGQAIAQRANDPLQNAAAIGILTQIEKAVGDPERCAKLLQVNTQFLKKFNTQIQE
ncbi:hypothetical protein GGF37_001453 [Kickxella alabastrina]|nr:hypothetical protein GGF37_001453 [Kickxella alabastrina]